MPTPDKITRYTDPATLSPSTLLDAEDVAVILRRAVVTLKNWRRDGMGPRWIAFGNQRLYRAGDLVEWLDEQAKGNPGSSPR